MIRLNKEELKQTLKTNKQFIKYNNGNEINTIKEHYWKGAVDPYTYIINDKIAVQYVENMGNHRRQMYLRIIKLKNSDINWYNTYGEWF